MGIIGKLEKNHYCNKIYRKKIPTHKNQSKKSGTIKDAGILSGTVTLCNMTKRELVFDFEELE